MKPWHPGKAKLNKLEEDGRKVACSLTDKDKCEAPKCDTVLEDAWTRV